MAKVIKGFKKGYGQLKLAELREARPRMFKALGINNRNSFALYKKGKIEMKYSQVTEMEEIFREYKIMNPWD